MQEINNVTGILQITENKEIVWYTLKWSTMLRVTGKNE